MFTNAMFALDECIAPSSNGIVQTWFEPMLFDPAYLYALCFTIPSYFDGLCGRIRSAAEQQRDCVYYAKTVRLLQQRLALDDEDALKLSTSTVMTVLALSGHAYSTGDYESANYHIRGLLKLVSMRGAATFLTSTKLAIEIIR